MTKSCNIVREQDEFVCNFCGIRWGVKEDKPETACSQEAINKVQFQKTKHLLNKKPQQ